MEMVISNHFLNKDLVHHPIDSQPIFTDGIPSGSRKQSTMSPCLNVCVGERACVCMDENSMWIPKSVAKFDSSQTWGCTILIHPCLSMSIKNQYFDAQFWCTIKVLFSIGLVHNFVDALGWGPRISKKLDALSRINWEKQTHETTVIRGFFMPGCPPTPRTFQWTWPYVCKSGT